MSYFVEHKTYPYYIGQVRSLGSVPHIHNHLEMVYVCDGKVEAQCDRKKYEMKAGDLFLAFPNQIHSYLTEGTVKAYVMIFSAALTPQLNKLLSGRIPSLPVIESAKLSGNPEEDLFDIYTKKRSGDPYLKLHAMGDFLSFLSRILPLFEYEEDPLDYDSMQKILTYCAQHFTEEITLEILSRELFLNKYYISHLFRKRMEISFHDFLSFLRVNRACELLEKNDSITDVALNSGFSSVRTFNRVFREVMEMTPLQYRKKMKSHK